MPPAGHRPRALRARQRADPGRVLLTPHLVANTDGNLGPAPPPLPASVAGVAGGSTTGQHRSLEPQRPPDTNASADCLPAGPRRGHRGAGSLAGSTTAVHVAPQMRWFPPFHKKNHHPMPPRICGHACHSQETARPPLEITGPHVTGNLQELSVAGWAGGPALILQRLTSGECTR